MFRWHPKPLSDLFSAAGSESDFWINSKKGNGKMKSYIIIIMLALCSLGTCATPNEPSLDHVTLYNDVLDAFKGYVNAASRDSQNDSTYVYIDDFFNGLADGSEEVWNGFYTGISLAVRYGLSIDFNMQNLGFAIKDLNGDGVPELVLLTSDYFDYFILGAFSFANSKPQLLGGYWDRHPCKIDSSGLFYVHRSGGASGGEWAIQQIAADGCQLIDIKRLIMKNINGARYDNMIIDGEEYSVSESEIEAFFEVYRAASTEQAGLEFVPLADI